MSASETVYQYSGELVLRSHYGEHGEVTGVDILHADPCIRINAMVLDFYDQSGSPDWVQWDGRLVKVHGRNRSVVYRVIGRDGHEYLAEWPD